MMVERRVVEDAPMLAEGLAGAIPPTVYGTGRICKEARVWRPVVALQQHGLVCGPREPGGDATPLRQHRTAAWPSSEPVESP